MEVLQMEAKFSHREVLREIENVCRYAVTANQLFKNTALICLVKNSSVFRVLAAAHSTEQRVFLERQCIA